MRPLRGCRGCRPPNLHASLAVGSMRRAVAALCRTTEPAIFSRGWCAFPATIAILVVVPAAVAALLLATAMTLSRWRVWVGVVCHPDIKRLQRNAAAELPNSRDFDYLRKEVASRVVDRLNVRCDCRQMRA
jgi:hypothetical protein